MNGKNIKKDESIRAMNSGGYSLKGRNEYRLLSTIERLDYRGTHQSKCEQAAFAAFSMRGVK